MTESEDNLDDVASGPKRASGDSGSIDQHSLSDLMKYADRKAAASAFDSKGRPRLHVSRMIPPGAI